MAKVQLIQNYYYGRNLTRQTDKNNNKNIAPTNVLKETPLSKPVFSSQIVSFGLSTSAFKLSKYKDIHCPSCGKLIMITKQYDEFIDELSSVPPEKYIEHLAKYKRYMADFISGVFDEIVEINEKNPTLDLKQILYTMRKKELPKLQVKQLATIEDMKAIVGHKLSGNDREAMNRVLNRTVTKIKRNSIDKRYFTRKGFIADIKTLELENNAVKDELVEKARTISRSLDSRSAWVIKYSGYDKKGNIRTNREIAESILKPSVVNVDHLQASALGGKNTMGNYVPMHTICNSSKANKSVAEWLSEDYNRVDYFKLYLKDAQKLVDEGKLPKKYNGYPRTIKDRFNKLIYHVKGLLIE